MTVFSWRNSCSGGNEAPASLTLRERSSSVTLCSAVERNDHHCVERNRELIPPDTGMFRVMDGAGDGSLWIRWRIVFSSLRAAVPFLRTWKANSGIRACPYSTKNWNKTRKKRSEHHWSSVAALFPSGTMTSWRNTELWPSSDRAPTFRKLPGKSWKLLTNSMLNKRKSLLVSVMTCEKPNEKSGLFFLWAD